mgnify:FL=1
MDFADPLVIKWLGKNLERGKLSYDREKKRIRDTFIKNYPWAKEHEFEFRVTIDNRGDVTDSSVVYIGDGSKKLWDLTSRYWKGGWDITANVFKYKYSSALYFGPTEVWNPYAHKNGAPFRSWEIRGLRLGER